MNGIRLTVGLSMVIASLAGCNVDLGNGRSISTGGSSSDSASNNSSSESSDDMADTEDSGGAEESDIDQMYQDKLLIQEDGDGNAQIVYNSFSFGASYDYDNSAYVFYPDEDGSITGHVIACTLDVSLNWAAGDCYSNGRTCAFTYNHDEWTDNGESEFSIYLPYEPTTCAENGEVGPFVVPSTSSACGDTPLPRCPFGTDSDDTEDEISDNDQNSDSDDASDGDVNINVNIGDNNQNVNGNNNSQSQLNAGETGGDL